MNGGGDSRVVNSAYFQSGSRYRTATEPKLEGSVRFGSDDNFKNKIFDSGS